jgi:hypothetical protein
MIKIGFVVQDKISFELFRDLIVDSHEDKKISPTIIIAGQGLSHVISQEIISDIDIIDPFEFRLSNINAINNNRNLKDLIPQFIKLVFVRCYVLYRMVVESRELRNHKKRLENILQEYEYIVTSQDKPFNTSLLIVAAAKSVGARVIQIPCAMIIDIDQGAWSRKKQNVFLKSRPYIGSHTQSYWDTCLNNIIAYLAPGQVINSKYGKMLPYEALVILKLKLAGLLVDNLWFHGTKYADYILVADSVDYSILSKNYGFRGEIFVFGSPFFDKLEKIILNKEGVRSKIYAEYGLDKTKKLIIFNVQNLAEHKLVSESESDVFYDQVLALIKNTGQNLLLTMHPSMNIESYRYLEEKFKCRICLTPLIEYMPAADIFLTGPNSSTLRFAEYSGVQFCQLDFFESENESLRLDRGYRTSKSISDLTTFLVNAICHKNLNPKRLQSTDSFNDKFINFIRLNSVDR